MAPTPSELRAPLPGDVVTHFEQLVEQGILRTLVNDRIGDSRSR